MLLLYHLLAASYFMSQVGSVTVTMEWGNVVDAQSSPAKRATAEFCTCALKYIIAPNQVA